MLPLPPKSTLFPYTTLFRSEVTRAFEACIGHSLFRLEGAISFVVAFREGLWTPKHIHKLGQLIHKHASQGRSEEHTSELQSRRDLVCRLLLEKKKQKNKKTN